MYLLLLFYICIGVSQFVHQNVTMFIQKNAKHKTFKKMISAEQHVYLCNLHTAIRIPILKPRYYFNS